MIPQQIIQELITSDKFIAWNRNVEQAAQTAQVYPQSRLEYKGRIYTNLMVDEKHFSPTELAEAWGVSAETIRILFKNEPGVLRLPSQAEHEPKAKVRKYESLKIPQSVAERVHKKFSAVPQ
jgi:hypothetical protein